MEKSDLPFCDYIDVVSKNPYDTAPRITVRYYLALKDHVKNCEKCLEKVDRVLKNEPPKKLNDEFNEN